MPDKGLFAPVRSSQNNLNVTSKMTHYSSNGPQTAQNDTQWKAGGGQQDILAASLENSKQDNDSLTGFKPLENSPSFGSEGKNFENMPKS